MSSVDFGLTIFFKNSSFLGSGAPSGADGGQYEFKLTSFIQATVWDSFFSQIQRVSVWNFFEFSYIEFLILIYIWELRNSIKKEKGLEFEKFQKSLETF